MPLIIWEPRRYEQAWPAVDLSQWTGSPWAQIMPINGEPASGPKGGDHLIREVSRFTGSKTMRYRDTGEFEATIPAGQVEPKDIKAGRLVDLDGDMYVIENYEWQLGENGYSVTISGRDFGLYLDTRYVVTEPTQLNTNESYGGGGVNTVTAKAVKALLDAFFLYNPDTGLDPDGSGIASPYGKLFEKYDLASGKVSKNKKWGGFEHCGWWVDTDRCNDAAASIGSRNAVMELGDESVLEKSVGTERVEEATTWGALVRTWCSWLDLGYRFRFTYDSERGVYRVSPVVYNRMDSGKVLRSNSRGVSGFKMAHETRDTVSAVIATAKYKQVVNETETEYSKVLHVEYGAFDSDGNDLCGNWCEVSEQHRQKFVDYGDIPEDEYDQSGGGAAELSAVNWLDNQMRAEVVRATDTIEFEYDNSGQLRYGEDFFLGSRLSIVDDYLGTAQTSTLTEVKAKYDAGAAVSYKFTFGDRALTTADKLKSKLGIIDRRTFAQGTKN